MKWLVAVLAVFWVSAAPAQEREAGMLSVTGEERIDSPPDMATITMGVSYDADTAGAALQATSEATAAMLAILEGADIAARDMQTRDLSLQPIWDNRSSSLKGPRVSGYRASNTVVVRVRDLPKLGGVLDRVVQEGANTFHGLSFDLQNPRPALDAAREAAVADAMRKAALFANAAGLRLGPVVSLTESGSAPQPMRLERMAAMSEAVPIAEGEVTISASVTMVFELADQ